MSQEIPAKYRDLLENPYVVSFATVTDNGEPNVSPVWASYDGTHILINSAEGRKKDRNVRQNRNVAVMIVDPENMYRYLEVRGVVEEITTDGAVDHIDQLAKMYVGVDSYYGNMSPQDQRNKETRVIYKIKPVNVIGHG